VANNLEFKSTFY